MTGEKEEGQDRGYSIYVREWDMLEPDQFQCARHGSDIWLFGKATNLPNDLDNVIVILTPSFNGNVWYKKDVATGVLTIYGDQAGQVSYGLTAPRFDASQWPNAAPAGETPSFTIN